MRQAKLFTKPQPHKGLYGNIDKIDFFCVFKPSVKNIYASFFPPFLSSRLNPDTVGKATRDKSTSNIVQGKYLHSAQIQISPGLGKGSWNRQLQSRCPVSVPSCLQCWAQWERGRETLGSPLLRSSLVSLISTLPSIPQQSKSEWLHIAVCCI